MTITAAREFLTSSELALELRVVPNILRRAVALGIVVGVRVGRMTVFPVADLDQVRAAMVEAGLMPNGTDETPAKGRE